MVGEVFRQVLHSICRKQEIAKAVRNKVADSFL